MHEKIKNTCLNIYLVISTYLAITTCSLFLIITTDCLLRNTTVCILSMRLEFIYKRYKNRLRGSNKICYIN